MKILLAKRRAMGDTILLSSTVSLLKEHLPGAEISTLIPEAFRPVLENHPGIHKVFSYEEGFLALLRKIRSEHFDYFLQLHSSKRWNWLGLLSGASHFFEHRQNAQTEVAYGKHPNALEWDVFFLRTLFPSLPFLLKNPKITLTPQEKDAGAKLLILPRGDGGVSNALPGFKGKAVFLGLGASRPTKRWPHFARLAELLRERLEMVPVLVAGPGEEEEQFVAKTIDEMRARGLRPRLGGGKGDFLHFAGLDVRRLASLISATSLYIGNDSGPKHMAVALDIPTFTFFGPEDPVEWHPYSRAEHPYFFLEGLPCRREDKGRWCGLSQCREERHRCMRDINPEEVLAQVEAYGRAHVR